MLLLITEPLEICLAKKLINQLINQTNILHLSQSIQLALVYPSIIYPSIHSSCSCIKNRRKKTISHGYYLEIGAEERIGKWCFISIYYASLHFLGTE